MSFTPALRADITVADLGELATVWVASIAEGANAWVESEGDYWVLEKNSGAPLSQDVIAPLPGAPQAGAANARWIRFSSILPQSGITQLIGDVTAGPGSGTQVAVVKNIRTVNDLLGLSNLSANDGIALVNGAIAFGDDPYIAGIYVFRADGNLPAPDGLNVVASNVFPGSVWIANEYNRMNVPNGFALLNSSGNLFVGPTGTAPFQPIPTFESEEQTNATPSGGLVNLLGTTTVGQVPTLGHLLAGSLKWKVRQEYAVGQPSDADHTFYAENYDEIIGPVTVAAPRAWLLSNDYSALSAGIPPKSGMRVRFVARQTGGSSNINVTANSVTYILRANSGAGCYRTLEFVYSGTEWVLSLGALA